MAARKRPVRWVIGIDEVGRGALAGPVTVAAALLAVDTHGRVRHAPYRALKDSKKLAPAERERWAKDLRKNMHVGLAIARVYPRAIDRMNVSAAANLAALRAYERIMKMKRMGARDAAVFLDGGLYLGGRRRQETLEKQGKIAIATIIKGDERIPAVAAASIVAKVSRDRFMTRLARRYPKYGFDVHKGYGTAAHRRAIAEHGRTAAHRLTFIAKLPTMNG